MKDKKKQLVKFYQIRQLPVKCKKSYKIDQQRVNTDVCCIVIGVLFALTMAILAITLFNFNHYYKANFPSDTDGRLCGIDKKTLQYPYVYFVNPPDISRRVCVQECPKIQQQFLKCFPTQNIGCRFTNKTSFEVINYQTQQANTRSGYFCYPQDPTLKNQVLTASKLLSRNTFYNSIDVIKLSFFVSIGISIIYLLCVQFFPRKMNYIGLIVGCIMILITIGCILIYSSSERVSKIIQVTILAILFILISTSACRFVNSWRINEIFLNYSTNFVRQRKSVLLFIPLFFIALYVFIAMIVLEFTAFWSSGQLVFHGDKQLFYQPVGGGPIVLTVILVIQILWGFSFLKSAFNFCVSYITVHWYYGNNQVSLTQALKAMLFKNLGSIIGGSFITSFFLSALDYLFDIFKPNDLQHPNSSYTTFYVEKCKLCSIFFDLVRQDAISFISLTGNPYCNSSRYCQYLCDRSIITDYALSTSRSFRISTHFLIGTLMVIFSLYINGKIQINAIYFIILITLSVGTLFISFHCDIADAIQIIFLLDQQFGRRNQNKQYEKVDIDNIHQQLGTLQLRNDLVQEIKNQRLLQHTNIKPDFKSNQL